MIERRKNERPHEDGDKQTVIERDKQNREREREREGNNVRNIQTVKYSEGNKIDREKEED